MIKAPGWILMSALIVGGAKLAVGQNGLPPGQPPWMSPAPMPPGTEEMEEARKVQAQLAKEASPELYAFEQRLRKIAAKIDKISGSFAKNEIDKAAAKEELLPLIREEQAIRNDPEFLAEQRLLQAYISSPDYRAKVQNMLRKIPARKKQKPK